MSDRLPRLTASDIIGIIEKRGFVFSRSSGSHQIFKNAQGKRITVPVHSGKILHPKVLKNILRDMEITPDELKKELERIY